MFYALQGLMGLFEFFNFLRDYLGYFLTLEVGSA